MSQIQDIHVCTMPKTVNHVYQLTCLIVSHLPLYLGLCMTITGYQIYSNNNNSQQQPTTGYRLTIKSLPGMGGPITAKTTTNTICAWQFKYANSTPIALCMSNVPTSLIFTPACRQKKHHITCHVKLTAIHQKFTISYTIWWLFDNYMCCW